MTSRPLRTFLTLLLAALGLIAAPAAAQEPSAAFKQRADEVIAMLKGTGKPETMFSEAFLQAVPVAQVTAISQQLQQQFGAPAGLVRIEAKTPEQGMLVVDFERAILRIGMAINPAPPHLIEGLLVTGSEMKNDSLAKVLGDLGGLPGTASLTAAKLGGPSPEILVSHNLDKPLAVGSAFKLVILAELVRGVNAGERNWTDEVALDGSPLPGGAYTQKPAGTRVTLKELAQQMISVSDNSATDILLAELGREKVEAMLPVVGIADPAGMRPFLSTLEMFKIKGLGGDVAQRWLAADEAGRRALLEGEIGKAPLSAINPMLFQDNKPILIDRVEWFASAADLVRVMDWLRRNSESGAGAEARNILAINTGGINAPAKWRYVGFKGGSEPGVMNLTYLLQGTNGDWYALAGSWNDPQAALDMLKWSTLMTRGAALLP